MADHSVAQLLDVYEMLKSVSSAIFWTQINVTSYPDDVVLDYV